MHYLYLIGAIISEVVGTSLMKESDGFSKIVPGAIAVVAYAVAFYLLSQTLKSIPTGVAYAIWSGVGIVLVAAIAWIFQGQKLDAAAIIGMLLIIVGVVVMNAFSVSGAR